jgi:hypothetical protein
MAYSGVSNFRFGLDSRRSELAQVPGTLEVLTNGHINQGGEIEKRKAFVRTALPAGTFGLQSDGTDLWVFGSAATPGGLPSGVQYQRLQVAVAVVLGVTQYASMTSVVYSTIHNGKLFVIANFDDGALPGTSRAHVFYDGVEVSDFVAGFIGTVDSLHLPTLCGKFTTYIDALDSGLEATQLAAPNDNKLSVVGVYGQDYTLTATKSSTHGVVNISKTADAVAPRDGTPAVASFRILGGSVSAGVNKITKVEVGPLAGPLVEITNAAVDFAVDNATTAAAVAASINTKTSTPDYTAVASLDTVYIYASASVGDTPNGYKVQVTCAGNVCVDDCSMSFVLTGTSMSITGLYANGVQILSAAFLNGVNNVLPGTATTMQDFVQDIADDIVANIGTHGFLAFASGNYLRVSRAVSASNSGDMTVNPAISGDGSVGGGITPGPGGPLIVTVPSTWGTILETTDSNAFGTSADLECQAAGGSGSYMSFLWTEETTGAANGITITSPNTAKTKFYCPGVRLGSTLSGRFVCTVVDSNGTKVTSQTVIVSFSAERFDTGNQ